MAVVGLVRGATHQERLGKVGLSAVYGKKSCHGQESGIAILSGYILRLRSGPHQLLFK